MHTEKRIEIALCVMVPVLFIALAEELRAGQALPRELDRATTNSAASDIFKDIDELTLAGAQRIALTRNPSVMKAMARIDQAKAVLRQANSRYWPRVEASGEASRVDMAENAAALTPSLDDPTERYSVGLSASYVLFDGFYRRFATKMAGQGCAQAELSMTNARRLTRAAVSVAYYNAQLALSNVRIAKADVAFYEKQQKDAEARHRAGNGTLSDKLTFEVRVNSARAAVVQGELSYRTSRIALATLLGSADIPEGVSIAPLQPEGPDELVLPDSSRLRALARKHRPDLLRATVASERAAAGVASARSGYMPTIVLTGSYGGDRYGDASIEGDDLGYTAGAAIKFNILDGGLTRARVSQAKAEWAEARVEAWDVALAVDGEILQRFEALRSARDQVVLQRANAALVRRARDLVENEYRRGETSLVRLNEAQRDLTNADSRLALAIARMRLAWSELEAATGADSLEHTRKGVVPED